MQHYLGLSDNIIMSKIKIGYEGKYFLVKNDMESMEDIYSHVVGRFPSLSKSRFQLLFDDVIAEDFKCIKEEVQRKKLSCIKFELKTLEGKFLSINNPSTSQSESTKIQDDHENNTQFKEKILNNEGEEMKTERDETIGNTFDRPADNSGQQDNPSIGSHQNDSNAQSLLSDEGLSKESESVQEADQDKDISDLSFIDSQKLAKYDSLLNKYAEDVNLGVIRNSTENEEDETPAKSKINQKEEEKCEYCNSNLSENKGLQRFIQRKIKEGIASQLGDIERKFIKIFNSKIKSLENSLQHLNKQPSEAQLSQISHDSQQLRLEPFGMIKSDASINRQPSDQESKQQISKSSTEREQLIKDIEEESDQSSKVKYQKIKTELSKCNDFKNYSFQYSKQTAFFALKFIDDLVIRDHPTNLDRVNVGDDFIWKFMIKTELNLPQKIPVWVIDKHTSELKRIMFKADEVFELGPYKVTQEGKFEKFFKLYFIDEKFEMQYFGPEFSLSVDIVQPLEHMRKENELKEKVEGIRVKYKKKNEVQEIIQILKEMGINPDNQDLMEQIIAGLE